jgi:hypothetical protein
MNYARAAWWIFLAATARRLRLGRYVIEDLDAAAERAKWACAREIRAGALTEVKVSAQRARTTKI